MKAPRSNSAARALQKGVWLSVLIGLLRVAGIVVPAVNSPAPLALVLTDFSFTEAAFSFCELPWASVLVFGCLPFAWG